MRKLLLSIMFFLLLVSVAWGLNPNQDETYILPAGQVLTITAPSGSTGSVVRLPQKPGGGNSQSTTTIAGADLYFGPYAAVERFKVFCTAGAVTPTMGIAALSTDGTMASNSDSLMVSQKAIKTYVDTGQATVANNILYVDKGRTDTYTADGTAFLPYTTIKAATDAMNAELLTTAHGSYRIKVAPGTYSDKLTITGPQLLIIEGTGVIISGTIAIDSGVGNYDRIEFVGTNGGRAEKGPGMTISGIQTLTRANDSLIYVGYHGCLVSGAINTVDNGTWVMQFENCRVNGAITGTFAEFTGTSPNASSILIETYGFNEFAGTINGITSLYNVNGADFYAAINTQPEYSNKFTHCSFGAAVTIAPQGGADSALVYVDAISYKSLLALPATLTAATYSHLQGTMAIQDADAPIFTGDVSLTGGGKVTKDLPFTLIKGSGTATNSAITGTQCIMFDGDGETAYISVQGPVCWDGASDFTLHALVQNATAETDGDDIDFTVTVHGAKDGDTNSDAGQTVTFNQNLTGGDEGQNRLNEVEGTIDYNDGTYPIAVGDTIIIKLAVNLGEGTECTGGLAIVHWGLKYTANKLGEAQ